MSEYVSSLPSVRLAITEVCNEHCRYCPEHGDSVTMQNDRLDVNAYMYLVEAALDAGFTDFSITGGEPLLHEESAQQACSIAQLINERRAASGKVGYTKLNTNGANLVRYQKEVQAAGFSELKVSLDTLDPETFTYVTGRNERVFGATIDGIMALKEYIPTRLQTVVGKYNVDELPAILWFCRLNGLDIKLFDISRYDNALSGPGQFCDAEYVPLAPIADELERNFGAATIKYAVGGYGHPKQVFTASEGTTIEIRDTAISAHYSAELCNDCPKYPCQDGLCNVVIAADGHIRFCREGGAEQTLSTRSTDGELLPQAEISQRLAQAAGIFAMSKSLERSIIPIRRLLPLEVISRT